MKLNTQQLWAIIEGFNWSSDHNYNRISLEFSLLSKQKRTEVAKFFNDKMDELNSRFEADWLANPGIRLSDDGWSDLRAEVIGRGQKCYNDITAKELKRMAVAMEYYESFAYGIKAVENERQLSRYRELQQIVTQMERTPYAVKSEYHRLMHSYYLELEILQGVLTC